jgi:hypothetical protein
MVNGSVSAGRGGPFTNKFGVGQNDDNDSYERTRKEEGCNDDYEDDEFGDEDNDKVVEVSDGKKSKSMKPSKF